MQAALSDSKLQAVQAQLERRGVQMNSSEAMALKLPNGEQLLIPFGDRAHLVWTRTNGQTTALGLLRQGNQTLNLSADGSERRVRMLEGAKVQRLLGKLRERAKFQEFEQKLREKGKRVAENKLRVLLDETGNTAILGLVNEGSDRILHQLRIRLKANKDDELDDNAEPQIQVTACGKASGDAVAQGAQLQPQELGEFGGGTGSYTPIEYEPCISQWGYSYQCYSTTPKLSVLAPLSIATFVGMEMKGKLVIWNSGGGRLTGTAAIGAPFTLVSGGSFSLWPGQPQEIIVGFNVTVAGESSATLFFKDLQGRSLGTAAVQGVAVRQEDFFKLLSGLSQGMELNTLIPMGTTDVGLLGFKNLSSEQIAALVELATSPSSLGPSDACPPAVRLICELIESFLITQILSVFQQPDIDMVNATNRIVELAGYLAAGTDRFLANYESFKSDKAFAGFIGAIRGMFQQGGEALYKIFGATADSATIEIIRAVAAFYNSSNQTDKDRLTTTLKRFGPAVAFGLSGLDKIDNSTARNVLRDVDTIVIKQFGNSSLLHGGVLWRDLSRALGILGAAVSASASDRANNTGIWKEFREILAALAVTSTMVDRAGGAYGDPNGWKLFNVRTVFRVNVDRIGEVFVKVDVIAGTKVGDKPSVILGQFFHAITGYDSTNLAGFMEFLKKEVAGESMAIFDSLTSAGKSYIADVVAYGKVGGVVAVSPANATDASNVIQNGLQGCSKCFAVLIEVDSNGLVTNIRWFGLTEEEAIALARRMGFVRGELAPWAKYGGSGGGFPTLEKRSLTTFVPVEPRNCSSCHN